MLQGRREGCQREIFGFIGVFFLLVKREKYSLSILKKLSLDVIDRVMFGCMAGTEIESLRLRQLCTVLLYFLNVLKTCTTRCARLHSGFNIRFLMD